MKNKKLPFQNEPWMIMTVMLLLCWMPTAWAQVPYLVRDIKNGPSGSVCQIPCNPGYLTMNGVLYFTADDGVNGQELWKSDGKAANTIRLTSSQDGVYVLNLTRVNGMLYFITKDTQYANGGSHGSEYCLWKSDGTAAGTVQVTDITSGSEPSDLIDVNGVLYFWVNDGTNGSELWKSDGTAAGTARVIDDKFAQVRGFQVQMSGLLYFGTYDGVNGPELWKSDGTAAGTIKAKIIMDRDTGISKGFGRFLINVNGVLYFSADAGAKGMELWKSDGTEGGTVLIKNIASGSDNAEPVDLTDVNGVLYFWVDDELSRYELWKSDGTAAGTVKVRGDYLPAHNWKIEIDGRLYFGANDGINGEELWVSDGTEAGTVLLKDIVSGPAGSQISDLTNVNGVLYFVASDGVNGMELWKSDGTEAGTLLVSDIRNGSEGSSPANLTNVNGKLFFSADNGISGNELWSLSEYTAPPACATGVTATPNVNCGNYDNVISWSEAVGADGYNLKIGIKPGGNENCDRIVSGLSYSFTGNPDTTYYYTVTPYNSLGPATACAEQLFSTNASKCYCIPEPTGIEGDGITEVQLGRVKFFNESKGFGYFSATQVYLAQGVNCRGTIKKSKSNISSNRYITSVYIDFNDDYVFESSEIVFSNGSTGGSAADDIDTSFLMPADANLGDHRLRICVSDAGNPVDPCYSGENAVTLDFDIKVVETDPLTVQTVCTGTKVSNLIPTGTKIKWYGSATATTPLRATALLTSKTYYYIETIGNIVSERSPVAVIVNPIAKPGKVSAITNGVATKSVCLGGDITFVSTDYIGDKIEWQYTTDAPLSATNTIPQTWYEVTEPKKKGLNAVNVSTSRFYYRAKYTSGTCTTAYSAAKAIIVNPTTMAGTASAMVSKGVSAIDGAYVVCSLDNNKVKVSGHTGKVQWKYSTDDVTYHNVPTVAVPDANAPFTTLATIGTGASYAFSGVTAADLYFKAVIISGACLTETTNVVHYKGSGVSAVAGSISTTDSLPLCPTNTGAKIEIKKGLVNDSFLIEWYKSTNWNAPNPTWRKVTATGTTLNTGVLTVSTAYRAKSIVGGIACSNTATTEDFIVTVVPKLAVKKITSTTTAGNTSSSVQCTTMHLKELNVVGTNGDSFEWETYVSATPLTAAALAALPPTAWEPAFTEGGYAGSYQVTVPVAGVNYFRVKVRNDCGDTFTTAAFATYYKTCSTSKMVEAVEEEVTVAPFAVVAYPNPYADNFNLRLTATSDAKVGIMVYDMLGRLIEQRAMRPSEGQELQIGDRYSSGVYNVIVTQGTEQKTLRVVKK